MNYYEAQKSIKELFPDSKITMSFDSKCVSEVSQSVTDGNPHENCICTMDKVKFDIDGKIRYMKIKNHKIQMPYKDTLSKLSEREVYKRPEVRNEAV